MGGSWRDLQLVVKEGGIALVAELDEGALVAVGSDGQPVDGIGDSALRAPAEDGA